ncbi:CDP-alcohol phosphatidyltransferase family protein [Sulfurihydrogenibium subterraneum]|uniref:CDP-alcohol phosphatidyltransferase family protein n=1 Tax=Sulfurihydrogenibium subterraneum TaxID=171121 RepID=UPI00048BE10D|nr:CDP-alcohol phosphatidyltransferase family protein [Sulfurihydrogenibium subterraneum]
MRTKYTKEDLKKALKDKESWIAITFFEKVYTNIALWLANYTSLTPNTITFINFFIVISSALMFYMNNFIIGGILYLLFYILDGVDGTVARLKKISSKYGEFLDVAFDVLGVFFISISISWSLYEETKSIISFTLAVLFPYTSILDAFLGYLTREMNKKALSHSFSSNRYILVPLQSDFGLILFTLFGILNIKNPYFYFVVSLFYFAEIITSIILKVVMFRKK